MSENPRFDLVDIVHLIRRRIIFILVVAFIGAVLGGILALMSKKQYLAVTEFFIASPFFSDRNNVFHTSNQTAAFVGYFGGEEDIDKIVGISKTDEAKRNIIKSSGLASWYKLDTSKPADMLTLVNIFSSGFNLKRNEYGLIQISFKHEDPQVAANVANASLQEIDHLFAGFHMSLRSGVMTELNDKIRNADSAITLLTDSLAHLRDQYGIYDIISPSRQNIITGTINHSGKPGFGYAVEELQNIEAIKDQLVTDRSRYISISNEYSAVGNAGAQMLKVVSPARPPLKPDGFGKIMTVIICGALAFLFAMLWVLISGYFGRILTVKQ